MPIREGYADKVFIVTSGENMAIYAAANIASAVKSFEARGYASLGGLILNRRGVKREQEKTEELARDMGTDIIASLDFSALVAEAERISGQRYGRGIQESGGCSAGGLQRGRGEEGLC